MNVRIRSYVWVVKSICNNDKSRLIQLSFLMLFVELALIRWIGSQIVFVSVFTNFVLLASFLGIGIGFLRSKSNFNLICISPILLAFLIWLCYQFRYQYEPVLDPLTNDLIYQFDGFKENRLPIILTLPILFIAVTFVMASIADGVSRTFQKFLPLYAYRLEILGSLLGIVAFSILSYLHAAPFYWGLVISLLFILILSSNWKSNYLLAFLQVAGIIICLSVLAQDSFKSLYSWSPYYKVGIYPYDNGRYVVNVNGMPQQIIESVVQRKNNKPLYFYPYQYRNKSTSLDNVLIIGAGTGGDVAIALSEGARHVDAIEIDPLLYELGKRYHPDQPYSNPKVKIHINDGRAFLQKTTQLYDLIIYAVTDSRALLSFQSSLRLENYLYTLEGINSVKKHLKPDGEFAMYNYYGSPAIIDRLALTLQQVFKHSPCFNTAGEKLHWFSVLAISPQQTSLQCSTWSSLSSQFISPSTDDHPFFYLQENKIPFTYLIGLFFVFLLSLCILKISSISFKRIGDYFDIFLLGTAFLLLETKSIVTFALLFGTTWFVNALVFFGILFSIYLAIEVTNRGKHISAVLLHLGLLFSLVLAWFVSTSYLLSLPYLLRFLVSTILTFLPIFIANLIFTYRFRNALHPAQAFGANILGAVLGGLLEYGALIVGYQNLLIWIATLYSIAILLKKQLYKTA